MRLRFIKGLTLLETILGVAVIALVAFAFYRGYFVLVDIYANSKVKIAATTLANEEMEGVRNLPYASVGTVGGIPAGVIPPTQTKAKNAISFLITTTVRNIDDPFDGTLGGTPNDLSPADYKLVELAIVCEQCGNPQIFRFTAQIAPADLETASTNGALFIQAIDANGEPVSGATVQVSNDILTPPVNMTDTTGIDGFWRIIDAPPAPQSYRISVSKSGYSEDQTYATSTANPNPVKPDATVALQTATQATFAIDRVSTLNISSQTETCASIPDAGLTLTGAKLIGTTPDIPKFGQSFNTGLTGAVVINNLEWDSFTMIFSHATQDISGTIPNLPLNLAPNTTQNFRIILEPKNPLALLVTVKDVVTQLPLANSTVTLAQGTYTNTLLTGRGFLRQTDWSGGDGQLIFTDPSQYFEQDGNIEILGPAGEVKLKEVATSTYAGAGSLTSSIFDTGSASNFYNISWEPQSQPSATGLDSVKIQVATATTTDPASWEFKGPDATLGSYYTLLDTNINSVHNGDRYFRYKIYLATASTTFTPNVADIAVTFASDCVPSGQVFFTGLLGDTYTLTVEKTGYQSFSQPVTVNLPWQETAVILNPM